MTQLFTLSSVTNELVQPAIPWTMYFSGREGRGCRVHHTQEQLCPQLSCPCLLLPVTSTVQITGFHMYTKNPTKNNASAQHWVPLDLISQLNKSTKHFLHSAGFWCQLQLMNCNIRVHKLGVISSSTHFWGATEDMGALSLDFWSICPSHCPPVPLASYAKS